MSSFGSQIRKRLKQLEKAGQYMPQVIDEVAEAATIAAVEKAVSKTPPNGAGVAGTNMRTGVLAQAWVTDSVTKPRRGRTILANNAEANGQQYASYVNDGHRVDKHFVPGLIVNGDKLERVDPDAGGIMVGTQTAYVPGLYMKEAGIGAYRTHIRRDLARRVRELIERQNG